LNLPIGLLEAGKVFESEMPTPSKMEAMVFGTKPIHFSMA